jgi:nitric oxide dioxygenase
MTPEQINLIKSTVPVLRENGVLLTKHFYQRMLGNNQGLKEVFNLGHQRSGAQAQALANAVLAYAENIENPAVLMPVVELIAHKHVSLNIQAPDYSIVGENLLYSISEVLGIAMDNPLIDAWAKAYGQLADIFIQTEQAIYEQHQQTKGSWLGWRAFKIVRKEVESDEITSFYVEPVDGGALPIYQAGQYISVRVFVEELGLKQPRQYTLSTNPQTNYLRISVKREEGNQADKAAGWVSNTLHQLPEGAEIEISAPTGNFFLMNPNKTNVFISGGVGLTPMVAMLNQLVNLGMPQPVHFFHACRHSDVHAMKKHIEELKAQYTQLKTYIAYEFPHEGNVQGQDYDVAGRLELNKVDKALLPKEADYYLCGPMPFMAEQQKVLINCGISASQIHSEAFGTGGVHH